MCAAVGGTFLTVDIDKPKGTLPTAASLLDLFAPHGANSTIFIIYYLLSIIYFYCSPTHAQFLSSWFKTSHPVSVTKTRSSMRTPNSPGR